MIKEFIQLFRDPRMWRVIFVAPVIQLVVFGYAATTDIRHVALGLMDHDRSPASRALAAAFTSSRHFQIVHHIADEAAVRAALDRGDVQAVLCFPPGFGGHLASGRTAPLQLLVDGAEANTAGLILAYANRIVRAYARDLLHDRLARQRGDPRLPGEILLLTRPWFNENLESRMFYVPGVIANITLLITLMLTSMAIVREKELGTIEQLIATPITPAEFILGKTLPFAIIGLADAMLIFAFGVLWFGVPVRGAPPLLFAGLLLFLLTSLGLGLLLSTVCRTQQQATMTTFFIFFPAMMLSGFIYPIANMPLLAQLLTYLNPLRYFLVILRGVFLKGVGFSVLWPQYVGLALLGTATLYLAMHRFKKTLA